MKNIIKFVNLFINQLFYLCSKLPLCLFRNLVRDTRGRKLQSIGEDAKKVLYLGKLGKDFEWSHLQQNIQFYECSAKNGDLMHLTDWLERKL